MKKGSRRLRGLWEGPKGPKGGCLQKNLRYVFFLALVLLIIIPISQAYGQNPTLNIELKGITEPQHLSNSMQIFLLITILSLAPSIVIMLTSFTRIAIVLSLVRQAIGIPQLPPSQIIIGMSLFLTFFIMAPVWTEINSKAIQPYIKREISQEEALKNLRGPLVQFFSKNMREKDIELFVNLSGMERPKNIDDVPMRILIPAFVTSELKTAFQMGFMIYIPFLVIDMVVSSILLSLGMMMLPPVMVSLPFKLILFVLADGWNLIITSLIKSFG